MQKISTILNFVLLIAVAVLFYLHFSSAKNGSNGSGFSSNHVKDSFCAKKQVVAYVELDSLNSQVNFIKTKKAALEAEQKAISTDLNNKYLAIEKEKDDFIKRGNSITQQEAEAFQQKYGQKQQELEIEKQSRSQQLAEKGTKIMDDMQGKLKDFLNDYNKDKKFTYILATGTGLDYIFYKDSSLNITKDIVKGLNEKIKIDGKP
jgi:outer membrane protein